MFNKLKQFKDLRNQAKDLQNQLKQEKVEVEKSGIKIIMDGNQEIISITFTDESMLQTAKKADIENRIKDATNSAIEKTKRVMAQKMQSMGGFENLGLGK